MVGFASPPVWHLGGKAVWGLIAMLSAIIALVSYRYMAGIGTVPSGIANNGFVAPWLIVHVASAATALLISPTQFLPKLRTSLGGLHRWVGRTYVVACIVGGVSGFVLALGSLAGPVATAGFGLLATLWVITTVMGWRRATQRRFAEHRKWMIRSFALTFAAVTLRLYLSLLLLTPIGFEDGYRAISFLCWVPNLLVAEFWLRRATLPRVQAAAARSSSGETLAMKPSIVCSPISTAFAPPPATTVTSVMPMMPRMRRRY